MSFLEPAGWLTAGPDGPSTRRFSILSGLVDPPGFERGTSRPKAGRSTGNFGPNVDQDAQAIIALRWVISVLAHCVRESARASVALHCVS